MSGFWSGIVHRLIARMAPDRSGLPPTYRSAAPDDPAGRPRIFDPALKQFAEAFRPGDPKFEDAREGARWVGLRRRVTDHVLRAFAESPRGEGLILRGSRLMGAWFGDEAREPGDLDWVVDPPTMGPTDAGAIDLLRGLLEAVFALPGLEGVELAEDAVATDEIWTYERAPGRRLVFPWRAPGLPGGSVQVDVVFGESLAEPARREAIPVADGGCVTARVASPAQSLAWKLLWLESDSLPQGKDLYDAVLLAERFPLPAAVLEATLRQGRVGPIPPTAGEFVRDWDVDWANFQVEYPRVAGDAGSWLARLVEAIGPAFDGREVSRPGGDPTGPPWLTTTVVDLARGIAADRAWDRLPILADALEEAGCERADLVGHCRAGGPHTRGCWAIDRILGEVRQ